MEHLSKVFHDFDTHADRIERAGKFAIHAHSGQVRKYEGIPYVTHPMAVSLDVAEKYQDADLVIAALLHDVVEDCEGVTTQSIYTDRGDDVGFIVEAVTDSPFYFVAEPERVYKDKIEKLLAGGLKDVRVLLLKIADRDHNLITLQGLKPNKQIRMTFETQAIYEPLRDILLGDDEACSLTTIVHRFHDYLEEHGLKTPAELKRDLFSQMYHNFNDETYQMAYKNTDTIVWQIEDKARFESLIASPSFQEKINIISMRTDGEKFKVRFSFVEGVFLHGKPKGKFKMYNLFTK